MAVTKRARQESPAEVFTLSVKGKRNFELLTRIRDSLEMTEQLVPDTERKHYIQQRRHNEYVCMYYLFVPSFLVFGSSVALCSGL